MFQDFLKTTFQTTKWGQKHVDAHYRHVHLLEYRKDCPTSSDRRREEITIQVPDTTPQKQVQELYAECQQIRSKYEHFPSLDISKKLVFQSPVPYLGQFKSMESGKHEKINVEPGEVVIIYVWASWCGTCIKPLDQINDLLQANLANQKWQGKISAHAICIEDETQQAWEMARNKKWHHLINQLQLQDSEEEHELIKAFQISGIPYICVIYDQKVTYSGQTAKLDLKGHLEKILEGNIFDQQEVLHEGMGMEEEKPTLTVEEAQQIISTLSNQKFIAEKFSNYSYILSRIFLNIYFKKGVESVTAEITVYVYENEMHQFLDSYKKLIPRIGLVEFHDREVKTIKVPMFAGFCFICADTMDYPFYWCKWEEVEDEDAGCFACRNCMEKKPQDEEGKLYNYDNNSILLISETPELPSINMGKNIQPQQISQQRGWELLCNCCKQSNWKPGIARYVCLYCRSDPNYFGDVTDFCETCLQKYLAGDPETVKNMEKNGHSKKHPYVRCLFQSDRKNY